MRTTQAFGLIVLATVVATISGSNLDADEDFLRSQQCGKTMKDKILGGTLRPGKDVPWLVQIRHPRYGNDDLKYHSGFLISDRHVVGTSDVLLDYIHDNVTTEGTFTWIRDRSSPAADMKTCVDRMMKAPAFALQNITVHSCAGVSSGDNCKKEKPLPIISAYYIGNCNTTKISYGLAILELATPIKSATPVCVPTNRIERVGDQVEVFGVGYVSKENTTSVIASKKSQVEEECSSPHPELTVCIVDTASCWWDDGGPIQKKVNGQEYAIGAIWTRKCENNASKQVSVGAFSRQICRVTGVCQPSLFPPTTTRKPPTTTTTAAKSKSRLVISKHIVLTKIAE